MKRQTEREQIHRLSVKTLDQVFIAHACEGLGCSMFEAQALTELIKEVYFPWLTQPEAIQAGQLAMVAVSADEPGHKPLSKCKMTPVLLTLYAGEEDHEDRLEHGITALRQDQIERMANEALDQGALLTGEDLAFRIFNCGLRTISRDLKALAEKGVVIPLRSQQKDAGRALTHRVQVVEMYLKRHTFTQIRQRMRHSLPSIANYLITFALVVAHTRDGHTVDEIAFLMQISVGLVSALGEGATQYNQQGFNGLNITFDAPERLPTLPAAVEVAVYRIAQEALTNVVRHAEARTCSVRLRLDESAGLLCLEVQDDGKGLPMKRRTGIGLNSMLERAEELGGTLTITSISTGGTLLTVRLPCRVNELARPSDQNALAASDEEV